MNERNATGHVRHVERARGDVFYARVRRPDGTQINRRLGRVWQKRGRPPAGFHTKATAEQELIRLLAEANEQAIKPTPTNVSFKVAAEEWLRFSEHDRQCRQSTLVDYRATARKLVE